MIEDYFINDLIYTGTYQIPKTLTGLRLFGGITKGEVDYNIKRIPYPHIFYALTISLHYLNKMMNPFVETNSTASMTILSKNLEDTRIKYAKLFYHFLLVCLKSWNKDLNNPSSLADFGRLWFAYIKPWEVNSFYLT